MNDDERARLGDLIERFLNDTGGQYDWDWVMTGQKNSQVAECIGTLCSNLDFLHPPSETGHFTNRKGEGVLREVVTLLRDRSVTDESVVYFVRSVFSDVNKTHAKDSCR